jgi:tetratricopeptide (TPR) repeat protein
LTTAQGTHSQKILDRGDAAALKMASRFVILVLVCLAAGLTGRLAAQPQSCQQAEVEADRGRQLLRQQNFEQAIATFRAAHALCREDNTILLGLTRAYLGAREFPQAEATAREVVSTQPLSVDGQFLLGYSLFLEKRFKDAAQTLQALLNQDHQNADARRVMGMALFFMGDYGNAQRALQDELRLHPDDQEAIYFLGGVYYAKNVYPQALNAYQHLVRLNPQSYQAFDALGLSCQADGQKERAREAFKRAEELSRKTGPPFDAPFTHSANLLLEMHRPDEALTDAREALRINPGSGGNRYLVGKALFQKNDLQGALPEINQSIGMGYTLAEPHYLLGKIYQKLGQQDKAKNEFAIFQKLSEKEHPNKMRTPIIMP